MNFRDNASFPIIFCGSTIWFILMMMMMMIMIDCSQASSSSSPNSNSISNHMYNNLQNRQQRPIQWTKRQLKQQQPLHFRAATATATTLQEDEDSYDDIMAKDWNRNTNHVVQLRAGSFDRINRALTTSEQIVKVLLEIVTQIGIVVLPPVFIVLSKIFCFYRQLPHDAIMAQAGLVYCFAGGYFPTLFAAIAAAQHSGMNIMLSALEDIYTEGTKAIEKAIELQKSDNYDYTYNDNKPSSFWGAAAQGTTRKKFQDMTFHEKFMHQTRIVLTTIDPMKINTALSSLYTTWLGISAVLERQFAKTIALSISIANSLEPMTKFLFQPPLRLLMPNDFHQWIPLLIQWTCKAIAMSIAWKIQRILTASSSALVGGLMFSRHLLRMIFGNHNNNKAKHATKDNSRNKEREEQQQQQQASDPTTTKTTTSSNYATTTFDHDATPIDEIIGLIVAGLGLYAQIGNGFSFRIPFPLNLITWPFSFAEHWIQWQITKTPASPVVV
jgi:hypothetical protein